MYIVAASNIMYLSLYFRYFTKLFYLIVEFQISCRTVAPPEIWVDGPWSYRSIHIKNCVYCAQKVVRVPLT